MVAWEPLTPQQFGAIRRGRPTAMPCLRPGCHKTCTYRQTGSGRQKLFCSDSCRVTYTRMRQRLADLWLTLEWNMGYLEPVVPLDDFLGLVETAVLGHFTDEFGHDILESDHPFRPTVLIEHDR